MERICARKIAITLGSLVMLAVMASACGSSDQATTVRRHSGPPRPAVYESSRALISALAARGTPCTRVHALATPTQPGALTLADCSGMSDGDTSVTTFTDHAHAIAFASRMISFQPAGSKEIVGPNWVVNTGHAYAAKVMAAIGGQLLTG